MGKLSLLHQIDSLTMPLADGATLRVTPFRESPRVAITFHGPGGGDAGGALLTAKRVRLLASWLTRVADECGAPARPREPGAAGPQVLLRRPTSLRERDAALAGLARLAVSVLADWCSIDVLEADGSLRRLPVAHARKLETDPPRMTGRGLRQTSSLTVRLAGHARTLGVMTLVSAKSGHRYAESDRLLARELGRLASLVLEAAHPGGKIPTHLPRPRSRRQRSRPAPDGR